MASSKETEIGINVLKSSEMQADDEAPVVETVVPIVVKKKRKKARKIARAEGFPKFYKNGYVRYCDKMRPLVCEENKNLDPIEVTKLVAAKWYSLSNEDKSPYLEEAKLDRERFKREVKEFNRDNPDSIREPTKKSKGTTKAESSSHHKTAKSEEKSTEITTKKENLQIFTDVFLEHNKIIETELKMLRKNNMESENSVLMKHVENMTAGVRKVESEIAATKQKNLQLEIYLTKLKCQLASSGLNSISLNSLKGASIENMSIYMNELLSHANNPAVVKASEIIRKMDLNM